MGNDGQHYDVENAEMSKKFGVTELKEVVSQLEKEYDQCQTCWPTTVFSQGSFTARKVFCCSKFVKADGGRNMTSPEEDSGVFSGVNFLLAGFEPAYENQFIEELEENGGVNSGTYDSSCTHVIVSNLAYDAPICAAARKDGKALVTDAWVADCLDNDTLADVNSVLYRPLKDLDGIPGSEDLCICLTGYQGQARQKIMRMVELIGARFTKPLLGNIVTHLICYKFEGEKYELAKKTGLKLINHFWLEDCLKLWSLLPEADYSRSGWDVVNEAKQHKVIKEKAEAACTLVAQKNVKKRTSISAEVPSPCPVEEVPTKRRESGIFNNVNSKAGSPSKMNTCSNSLVPSPSSLQKKPGEQALHDVSEGVYTVKQVAQRKLPPPEMTSLREGIKCTKALQASEIFHEAVKMADQRDETSPVRVKKSRRSSCGVANQLSPTSRGFREGAEAGDQCPTIDCGMELMSICADSASKKRVSGVEGVEKTELNITEKAPDFESPESKRRKSSKLRKSGLSPSVTKDRQDREQDVSAPVTKPASSQCVASLSGKLNIKQKLPKDHKDIPQDAVPSFGVPEALCDGDAMDMEASELSELEASPGNSHMGRDSKPQAVPSKQAYAPDDPPCFHKSLTKDDDIHKGDDASTHADTISSKEGRRRTIELSPPRSCAHERDVDMEDAEQSTHGVCKSKMAVDSEAKSSPKANKSAKKSKASLPSEDKGHTYLDGSALDVSVPPKDGPVKKSGKKGSPVSHCPSESSGKLVDNGNSPVAAERIIQQNVNREVTEHDVPLESVVVKKTAKKASKGSSSRARDKAPQRTGGFVHSDVHNEESHDRTNEKSPLEASGAEQVTSAATQAPISRTKKGHKSSKKDMSAIFLGEKDVENTNGGSRQKDGPLDSNYWESPSRTEAQASLSLRENDSLKKSIGRCDVNSDDQDKENVGFHREKDQGPCKAKAWKESSKKGARVSLLGTSAPEMLKYFAVGGSSDQRNSLHYLVKLLGAKVCKSRYEWRDDVTHVVLPVPLRRTEKFLAGAAAGRWILKPEYVEASRNAGKFVAEEEYEWFGEGTNDKGTISLDAPKKWRTQFASTGCGAFYGLRVLLYGESMSPPLGTLKRAIRAGGGFVLATTPPYSQHLVDGVDFAIINPVSVVNDDEHVQEFLKYKVACVSFDYFVDYICHPVFSLEKHILYNTSSAVAAAHHRLQKNTARGPTEEIEKLRRAAAQKLSTPHPKKVQVTDDIACVVCRRTDDEEVMLLCGDDKGRGCGLATHIHCCSPSLPEVPEEDWFCRNCEDL